MITKRFEISFHFIDFYNISIGINLCLNKPNIEIHIPFGFLRIGWVRYNLRESGIFRFTTKKRIEEQNKQLIK